MDEFDRQVQVYATELGVSTELVYKLCDAHLERERSRYSVTELLFILARVKREQAEAEA